MILRRLMEAFRRQDWFTVAVETLIVVLGVFLGLQVSNWNAVRAERALEQDYLVRLHDEISTLVDEQESDRADTVRQAEILLEVSDYLRTYATPEAAALAPVGDHCEAVIGSHIYASDIALPPSISELLATGRILLVSDENLRMKIVRFVQMIDENVQLRHDIQVDRMVLSRAYPDLIRVSPVSRAQSECDFPKMAQSQAFRNDFLDNAARFAAYAAMVIQGQQDMRRELHAALDAELSITHAEKAK